MYDDHNWRGRPLSKLVTGALPKMSMIGSRMPEESKYARLGPKEYKPTVTIPKPQPETSATAEKCPVCDMTFTDVMKLIEHSETHFAPPKPPPKKETEKWPIWNKAFAITELVRHVEQDHVL